MIVLLLVLVFVILLPLLVNTVQKQQETRRGAAGGQEVTPVIKVVDIGTGKYVGTLLPGGRYYFEVYLSPDSQVSTWAAGVDLIFRDQDNDNYEFLSIRNVQCSETNFPGLYTAAGGTINPTVRLSCYREHASGPLVIGQGGSKMLGKATVWVKADAPEGRLKLQSTRVSVPDATDLLGANLGVNAGTGWNVGSEPSCPQCPAVTLTEIERAGDENYNIKVAWDQVAEADEYRVYRNEALIRTVGLEAGNPDFEITDTRNGPGFAPGASVKYRVDSIKHSTACTPDCETYTKVIADTGECKITGINFGLPQDPYVVGWEHENCDQSTGVRLAIKETGRPDKKIEFSQCVSQAGLPFDQYCDKTLTFCVACKAADGSAYGEFCRPDFFMPHCPTAPTPTPTLTGVPPTNTPTPTLVPGCECSNGLCTSQCGAMAGEGCSTLTDCAVAPTATPTPTRTGPTNTPGPTIPPLECTCDSASGRAYKARGDANCDGVTDFSDYQIWFGAKWRGNPNYLPLANLSCDTAGVVDVDDFEVWRRNYFSNN